MNLCGACQKELKSDVVLCRDCAREYGVLAPGGRWKPRAEWPEWLRWAVADEQRRRRSDADWEERCIRLLDDEGTCADE